VGDGHFEFDGYGQVSVFGQSADGHGVVSDAGIGACAHVSVLFFSGDIGFRHYWDGGTDFDGCDFGGLNTMGGGDASEAAVGRAVTLPAGLAQAEFAAVGSAGPPVVTLTGPGGVTLTTPATADRIVTAPQGLALAVTSSKTTYFIVPHPAPGSWAITPAAGAAPPISYKFAKPLAPLGLTARVLGRGSRRRLTWRYVAQPGLSVRFVERGGTEQTIVDSSNGSGSRSFTIASGSAGRRDVIAMVSVDGVPRQLTRVASFAAPSPRLPRVAHASYRVRRGFVSVSWVRVRQASFVEVQITLAHGAQRYRLPGRATGARFRLARGAAVRRVSVIVSAAGIVGPAVTARLVR
jgi:hypothetical protein